MELDDLKNSWKATTDNIKPLNNDIMQMIQNKSYGPLALLKNRFRRQLIVLPLAVVLLISTLSKHHDIFSSVLFWCYIAICLVICGYYIFSYRLVSQMQNMETAVKSNLEQQIAILEKAVQWRLVIARIAFVFFIVLLELMMYLHQTPSLVKWYAQPVGLRIVCYVGLIFLFYFLSKFAVRYKYGKHIDYLKNLVEQM